MKKNKSKLKFIIFGIIALILAGCNSVQTSSYGSDNGGPSPSTVESTCGGGAVSLYLGQSGGILQVSSNDPTGAQLGYNSYSLNYSYLSAASFNASALNNGGENYPVGPSGPGLIYWMGGPAYAQHLASTQPQVWDLYWAPDINSVAANTESIFISQGYGTDVGNTGLNEALNLADSYGFGWRQGAYAADSWMNVLNNARNSTLYNNINLSFNVMWADVEDGGSPALPNSTGVNGWLNINVPNPYGTAVQNWNQYLAYENISIWNGFVAGLFQEQNFINYGLGSQELQIFPGMYSTPGDWNNYTNAAPLNNTLEWTANDSLPSPPYPIQGQCPSNTSYFTGYPATPVWFGGEGLATPSPGELLWQFALNSTDYDQINLNTFETDLYYLQGGCGQTSQICFQ